MASPDVRNQEGESVILAGCTSQRTDEIYPNEVKLTGLDLPVETKVQADYLFTVKQARLRARVDELTESQKKQFNRALLISLGLMQGPWIRQYTIRLFFLNLSSGSRWKPMTLEITTVFSRNSELSSIPTSVSPEDSPDLNLASFSFGQTPMRYSPEARTRAHRSLTHNSRNSLHYPNSRYSSFSLLPVMNLIPIIPCIPLRGSPIWSPITLHAL